MRKGINNLATEIGAVYLKNKLYFREGIGNLMQDFADLQERVDEIGSKPRYLLVTDYQHLLAKDTKTNETLNIKFDKLPQYFDFFFLRGTELKRSILIRKIQLMFVLPNDLQSYTMLWLMITRCNTQRVKSFLDPYPVLSIC